jgi:ribosomal protein S18 acetylase RimI-like enzyme
MTDNAIVDDTAATRAEGVRIRPLERTDLDAVVAVDQDLSGRSRRGFFARRLDHAARDPAGFAAFAAEHGGRIAGFVFARIEEGEFGATARQASLDAIGVELALAGGQGVGRALLGHLVTNLRDRGTGELATQVEWTDHRLLGFFSRNGFVLAPRIVLERRAGEPLPGSAWSTGNAEEAQTEGGTFESLPRDRMAVRSMARADLAALVAIDRRITGQDRPAYYARKLEEVFSESGVRMSLVADIDGHPAGFIMARVDFGEFGHTEPEAVMDTIGVDPRHGHEGVATALLSQLTANLGALRAESLRTEVNWNRFDLLGFLDRMGFDPHRRLALRFDLN